MKIQQKDIVLLPVPFSNLKENKVRPAVVISNNSINQKSDDCIFVALTSVIKDEPYSLLIDQKNLSSGNLIKPSRIRVDKIFSAEKKLIIQNIGTIDDKTFEKVKEIYMKLL